MAHTITIIIVTLNAENAVERTLSSVALQKYKNKRIIVVDGGSTDGTRESVQKYKNKLTIEFISEKDRGIYDAMNKGYRLVKEGVFGYLNAGDVFTSPDALNLISTLATHSDVISASVDFEAADGVVRRRWTSAPAPKYFWKFGWSVPHPGLYIKKDKLDADFSDTLFDDKFKIAADYDLQCRLKQHQLRWEHSGSVLVRMSYGGKTTSGYRSRLKNTIELWRVRRHNFGLVSAVLGVPGNLLFKIPQPLRLAPINRTTSQT